MTSSTADKTQHDGRASWKWIVLPLLALLMFGSLTVWLHHQLLIDKCLDGGRRWNYQSNVCER